MHRTIFKHINIIRNIECLLNKVTIRNLTTSPLNAENKSLGPLSGIRILDLTRVLAGPFATMILGDLGAEIIKVEKPKTGDDTRMWGPPFIGKESCYFLSVNRNKKSVVVDFKKPEGVTVLMDLAKRSDVFVENFVPGTLEKLGLGYEEMSLIAPQLIYCSLTGYGSSGPYANKPGYDVAAASIGGLLSVTGPKDGDPCKVGVAMTDLATGLYLHGAIMAAILQRQSSKIGQKIDCDLLSTQVSCLTNLGSSYLNGGIVGRRWGTEHESIVPYQTFKTKNGFITVGAGNDHQFNALCKLLDRLDVANDELYRTNTLRVKNRQSLIDILSKCFEKKTTNQWLSIMEGSSFIFGQVNSIDDTFKDHQVQFSEIIKQVDHSTVGEIKLVGPAVKYSQSKNFIRSSPPTLGQHTKEILKNVLEYPEQKIRDLEESNVVFFENKND